jgi:hypothetical protein
MKRLILAGLLALPFLTASPARADNPFACLKANCNTGIVPGPWYTYWPSDGGYVMTSQYANCCWTYESNFNTSAPIYPFWPTSPTPYTTLSGNDFPSSFPATGFQPGGYYPSYWYGN